MKYKHLIRLSAPLRPTFPSRVRQATRRGGQFVFTQLRIHLLRYLGYYYSDETITCGRAMLAPTVLSEVQAKTAPTPPLCKGRWVAACGKPEGLSATVSSAASIPGYRNMRIRSCAKAPMKIRSLSQLSLTAPFTQGSQCRTPIVRGTYGFLRALVTELTQKMYR